MSIYGHWQFWALLAGTWIGSGILSALIFGLIARVGDSGERGLRGR